MNESKAAWEKLLKSIEGDLLMADEVFGQFKKDPNKAGLKPVMNSLGKFLKSADPLLKSIEKSGVTVPASVRKHLSDVTMKMNAIGHGGSVVTESVVKKADSVEMKALYRDLAEFKRWASDLLQASDASEAELCAEWAHRVSRRISSGMNKLRIKGVEIPMEDVDRYYTDWMYRIAEHGKELVGRFGIDLNWTGYRK